jgi:uncharacterized protein
MKIDVAYLESHPEEWITYPLTWEGDKLELNGEEVRFLEPVSGSVSFAEIGDKIAVKGHMKTSLELSCGRCLGSFGFPVNSDFALTLVPGTEGQYLEDAYTLVKDELDLSLVITEQLLFALPIGPVCQPDCKGLCPECGRDLNEGPCQCGSKLIDPRWDALNKLLEDGKEGK